MTLRVSKHSNQPCSVLSSLVSTGNCNGSRLPTGVFTPPTRQNSFVTSASAVCIGLKSCDRNMRREDPTLQARFCQCVNANKCVLRGLNSSSHFEVHGSYTVGYGNVKQ